METDEQTSLLNPPNHLTININAINLKPDFALINSLPPEIWHLILDYLDIKNKQDLKNILYFFAPRIGVSKKWAKILAVNLSNYAALKANNLDDWQDKINNPCKSWENLTNYKKYKNNIKISRERIKKYLKIINKNFLEKIELYDQALQSNNKEKEIKKIWNLIEAEVAKTLNRTDISYMFDDVETWPKLDKCEENDLKKAYLEINKASLLGQYKLVKLNHAFATTGGVCLFFLWPLSILTSPRDNQVIIIAISTIYAIEILIIVSIIVMFVICDCHLTWLDAIKNILCSKKRGPSLSKLSENIICAESMIKNILKKYSKIEIYQDIILEFLNSELGEKEEEQNLDKLLTAGVADIKQTGNLKEEEK